MAAPGAKLPPALKHGAYSTAALLPGEDEAAFGRLHQGLIAELAPEGALEEHIVANLARFVWRRENLEILRVAKLAERRMAALFREQLVTDSAEVATARAAAKAKAGEELGEACELADAGATEKRLASEIELRARLDEMIDKCLKRLLFLRGLKSMARPAPAARIAHVAAHEVPMTSEVETVHAAG
jgi:hypothetical protein